MSVQNLLDQNTQLHVLTELRQFKLALNFVVFSLGMKHSHSLVPNVVMLTTHQFAAGTAVYSQYVPSTEYATRWPTAKAGASASGEGGASASGEGGASSGEGGEYDGAKERGPDAAVQGPPLPVDAASDAAAPPRRPTVDAQPSTADAVVRDANLPLPTTRTMRP